MTAASVAWVLSLASLAIAGAPLVLHRAFGALPWSARFALSCGTGAVLVSWLMTLWSLIGLRWNVAALLFAGLALSAGLRLAISVPPKPIAGGDGGWTPLSRLSVAAGILAVAAAAICTIAGRSSSPDLLFFWGPKAERFAAVRTIDAEFLRSPLLSYMHADYPPLLPNLYAWASLLTGRFSWEGATLLFPAALWLTYVVVRHVLRRDLRIADAEPAAALLIGSVSLIGIQSMFGGIGEMPLLFFETTAVALLCSRTLAGSGSELLAGLLLAGAASTKVEGLSVAVPAIAAYFLFNRDSARRPGSWLRLAAPLAVSLGTWLLFGRVHHLFSGYAGYGPLLEIHGGRIPAVLSAVVSDLCAVGYGLPFALPAAALVIAGSWNRRMAIPLASAACLAAFLVFTYLHGDGDPLAWIRWSAARVLSPAAALLVLAAACAVSHPRTGGPDRRSASI